MSSRSRELWKAIYMQRISKKWRYIVVSIILLVGLNFAFFHDSREFFGRRKEILMHFIFPILQQMYYTHSHRYTSYVAIFRSRPTSTKIQHEDAADVLLAIRATKHQTTNGQWYRPPNGKTKNCQTKALGDFIFLHQLDRGR